MLINSQSDINEELNNSKINDNPKSIYLNNNSINDNSKRNNWRKKIKIFLNQVLILIILVLMIILKKWFLI